MAPSFDIDLLDKEPYIIFIMHTLTLLFLRYTKHCGSICSERPLPFEERSLRHESIYCVGGSSSSLPASPSRRDSTLVLSTRRRQSMSNGSGSFSFHPLCPSLACFRVCTRQQERAQRP